MVAGDEGVGGEGAEVAVGAEMSMIRAPNPSMSVVEFPLQQVHFIQIANSFQPSTSYISYKVSFTQQF